MPVSKKDGYQAACQALFKLVGTGDVSDVPKLSVNILGDFNIAGETWIVRRYFERLGIKVVSTITGDGRVDDIRRAHGASLNLVQCSGSMIHLAKMMEAAFNIPFIRVSYFGIEDMSKAIYDVSDFFGNVIVDTKARSLVHEEVSAILPEII